MFNITACLYKCTSHSRHSASFGRCLYLPNLPSLEALHTWHLPLPDSAQRMYLVSLETFASILWFWTGSVRASLFSEEAFLRLKKLFVDYLSESQGVWLNSCLRRSTSAWFAVTSSGSWPQCGAARTVSTSSTWTVSRNGLDPRLLRQMVQPLNSMWMFAVQSLTSLSSTDPLTKQQDPSA